MFKIRLFRKVRLLSCSLLGTCISLQNPMFATVQQSKYLNASIIYANSEIINISNIQKETIISFEGKWNSERSMNNNVYVNTVKDQTITGKITDAQTGEAIAGVNIIIKGTNKGTTSNAKGEYQLTIPEKSTLVISSVGYSSQEVLVGNRVTLDITLLPEVKLLDETVVVGYGTVKKKDLVGSVGITKSKEFGEVSATNTQQLLQGKSAGVQVVNSNGLPGQSTRIFIRGTGTFTNPDPLYLIDGIPGDINSVAPQDIDEISVMKDASSVAIYGSRAANGVVIVNTKKSKSGTPRITYNAQYGVSKEAKRFELLNATDYVDLVKEMVGGNIPSTSVIGKPESLVNKTNWQDQIFQSAPQQNHYLNIAGGSEKVTYNISLAYDNQDGIYRPYNFERSRIRFALEEKIGRFKLGQNLNLNYTTYSGSTYSLDAAVRMPPYAPVEDANNLGGYYNVTPAVDLQDAQNPAAWINLRESKSRSLSFTTQLFGEVMILDGLKFKTQFQLSFDASSNWNYRKEFRSGNLYYGREVNEGSSFNYNPFLENFLTYEKKFGHHNINTLLGITYANNGYSRGQNVTGSNLTNDEIMNIGAAGTRSVAGSNAGTNLNARYSYFGRFAYDYQSKYYLTASLRRDYSPAFGQNNRYGDFPSVGIAWRVKEEAFMESLYAITDLKFRASYGKTGNDNIGLFRTNVNVYRGFAPASAGYSTGDGKTYQLGSTLSDIPNTDLRWEETKQLDLGLDLGLLNNKLVFTADYYNRNSDGLLINVGLPPSTGLGNVYNAAQIPLNAASVINRGFELSATYQNKKTDFKYSLNGNISFNHNEVTSLGTQGSVPIRGGSFNDVANPTKTDVGTPIGAFWGYRKDHVAIDAADVEKYNAIAKSKGQSIYQQGLKPGDIIFKDLNDDGVVNEKDQEYLGSPIPKIQYGGNINLGYKNFDLMIGLTGVSGVEIFNSTIYYLEGTNKVFNHGVGILDRWKKEGDIAKNPKANQGANGSLNLRASDRYVEDGSYLRFRNITLGYNLPKNVMDHLFGKVLQSARLYFTLQNFITITKYSGLDPEVLSSSSSPSSSEVLFSRGIGGYSTPVPKTWIFGVNIGF